MKKINLKKGSGLVEILVAIFIFSIILGSLIEASNMYLSGAGESIKTAQGAYIAEEGIEAVKILRDTSWTNVSSLTDNTNYYLYFDTSSSTNNTWIATSTVNSVDAFARTFKTNAVYRDSNGRIVTSGGTLDTNTEKITVSVSWNSKNGTTTKTLSTYITNII
jgi:type II secretory pathway pseudopilin PulG